MPAHVYWSKQQRKTWDAFGMQKCMHKNSPSTTDPGNILFRVGSDRTFSFDSSFDPEEETSTFAGDWATS